MSIMTLLLPRLTPPEDRPDELALSSQEPKASVQGISIAGACGQPVRRVRPSAESLVERLRVIQMQGWS